jgi:hypothetical protein
MEAELNELSTELKRPVGMHKSNSLVTGVYLINYVAKSEMCKR